MSIARRARLLFGALALAAAGDPARAGEPRLFDGHEPLTIELEADWKPIQRDDAPEPGKYPGTLRYAGPSGEVALPIQIEPSGRSRRIQDICALPPLRLDLPKQGRKGTLFRGIGELKLVTHCNPNANYESYVLLEYLVYRAYGLVTDESHRVRLLRVRYREPGATRPLWERFGFVIEDASDLAKRVGLERVAESTIDRARLDPAAASRAELFYYMVGMTDFSLVRREGGPCCHNARALRRPDGSIVPVPYDFDQTGVVDAEYANPDPRLGIRSVKQRRFRGQCRPPEITQASIALLQSKRAEIRALFEAQTHVSAVRIKRALAFLDEFHAWAEDPARVRETLAKECSQNAR